MDFKCLRKFAFAVWWLKISTRAVYHNLVLKWTVTGLRLYHSQSRSRLSISRFASKQPLVYCCSCKYKNDAPTLPTLESPILTAIWRKKRTLNYSSNFKCLFKKCVYICISSYQKKSRHRSFSLRNWWNGICRRKVNRFPLNAFPRSCLVKFLNCPFYGRLWHRVFPCSLVVGCKSRSIVATGWLMSALSPWKWASSARLVWEKDDHQSILAATRMKFLNVRQHVIGKENHVLCVL